MTLYEIFMAISALVFLFCAAMMVGQFACAVGLAIKEMLEK